MKLRYLSLLLACYFAAACSPSIERIQTILKAYISASDEDGSTILMNVEQTDKGIYTGTYGVQKDSLTLFVYPFTAIVKKDQVIQFFKDTDDKKVSVLTFLTEGQGQYHSDETGLDYNIETKAAYDERLRKEEEERARLAAKKSGSGLSQKGANFLLSHYKSIISVISSRKANLNNVPYQAFFGKDVVTYTYKVLETNGYGTSTAHYDVVFRNGKIVYSMAADSMDSMIEGGFLF